jgi:hypothetical protein
MRLKKLMEKFDYVYGVVSLLIGIIYIGFTVIIVIGTDTAGESIVIEQNLIFSIIGAGVGICMMFLAKLQGKTLGERTEEAMKLNREIALLENKKTATKKLKSFNKWLFWSTVKDIGSKGLVIAAASFGLFNYIYFMGTGDILLIGQALSNFALFTLFSLNKLVQAYRVYVEDHIEVLKVKLSRLKEGDTHE